MSKGTRDQQEQVSAEAQYVETQLGVQNLGFCWAITEYLRRVQAMFFCHKSEGRKTAPQNITAIIRTTKQQQQHITRKTDGLGVSVALAETGREEVGEKRTQENFENGHTATQLSLRKLRLNKNYL